MEPTDRPSKVLFLCTGNYYRSRFAEFYFRHLATERGLRWEADSRGLDLHPHNEGPMYSRTRLECQRMGVSHHPERMPMALTRADLESATLVVAVKEAEHRPLMREQFPEWEDRTRYWTVHDLDAGTPEQAFPQLRELVEQLVGELSAAG